MMKRLFYLILILACLFPDTSALAQDLGYARKVIDTLASPYMEGRGYVNHGDRKAAEYIASLFANDGLRAFGQSYFQPYSFPMNTFPGRVNMIVNGRQLTPARDFIIRASAKSIKGNFRIIPLQKEVYSDKDRFMQFILKDARGKIVLIDKKGVEDKPALSFLDSIKNAGIPGTTGLIYVNDSKLSWSVMAGSAVKPYIFAEVRRECLPARPKKIGLIIENEFIPDYQTQNVLAYISGSVQPDTFLVFTAHYDHLGRMGSQAYFPGASDNASGTAMLLDMARHYSQPENKPYYSMAFFALSGEEAGLHGANFCADHPPVSLDRIKFLINMDMVGTGSEGITMVNSTVFKDAYNRMVKINTDNEYILTVKERGESCNSDHCPFYKKGVPAVFIYSMGKESREYHTPDDTSANLPLTEYKDIFRLLVAFMNGFQPANN